MTVVVDEDFYTDAGTTAAGTQHYLIGRLPADSVLVDAYINVESVTTAATSSQVKVGTAENGAQVLALTSISTVGPAGSLVNKIATGTGQDLYMSVVSTGAISATGRFTVTIAYDEVVKNNGEYTKF